MLGKERKKKEGTVLLLTRCRKKKRKGKEEEKRLIHHTKGDALLSFSLRALIPKRTKESKKKKKTRHALSGRVSHEGKKKGGRRTGD